MERAQLDNLLAVISTGMSKTAEVTGTVDAPMAARQAAFPASKRLPAVKHAEFNPVAASRAARMGGAAVTPITQGKPSPGHLIPGHYGEHDGTLATNDNLSHGHAPASQPQTSIRPHIDVAHATAPQPKHAGVEHYALPSEELYPLDNHSQVKHAARYFSETYTFMEPPTRHEYCVNLVKRASDLSVAVDDLIEHYGSEKYASAEHIDTCLLTRQNRLLDNVHLAVLDKLASLRTAMDPSDFAMTLYEFDKATQLVNTAGVPDAYFSTFGKYASSKAADLITLGGESTTAAELGELAARQRDSLKKRFGEDFVEEFQKDPLAIFNSMPRDQKLVLIRMAASTGVAHSGV
jgi:hypothetical protein